MKKTIGITEKTHEELWLFKIKAKAKSLEDVIKILIEENKRMKGGVKDERDT